MLIFYLCLGRGTNTQKERFFHLKKFVFTAVAGLGLFIGGTVASAEEQTHVVAPGDGSGKKIEGYSSYKYTFEFVKENGERQEMTYELSGEDIQPYAPNTLVKAEISQKRIISGPNEVAEKDVPADVLKKLNAQK